MKKNTLMGVLVTGAPLVARRNNSENPDVRAVEISGLRRSGRGTLVPGGAPKEIAGLDGACKPLGHIGDYLIAASGILPVAVRPGTSDSQTAVGDDKFPGEALCAQSGAGMLTVMTGGGPVRVRMDGEKPEITQLTPDFPPVTLLASDYNPVSADVAQRTLGKEYTSGQLAADDRRNVVSDLVNAYIYIVESASAAGVFVQPVLARYKLRDAAGNLLYTSAPVLLSHTGGAQCCGSVGLESDDRRTVRAYTLTAESWRMSAVFGPSSAGARAGEVATAEVWVTPQFHPYHPESKGAAWVGRAASSGSDFLRVRLPGAQFGLGSEWKDNARKLIMKTIARIDEVEERCAVITDPFGESERTAEIPVSPDGDAAASSKVFVAARKKPVERQTLIRALLSPPHTFTATIAASDAGIVAWGNISVRRFGGYPAETMAARLATSGAWKMVTKVIFSDGSSLSRSDQGSGPALTLLSPVLFYPSPDAVEMDIRLTAGGVARSARFPLLPDESGRFSVFVAECAAPMEIPSESVADIAVTSPRDKRFPGAVVFADASDPLNIKAVGLPDGDEVRALCAVYTSGQSWEFGRCRFIAGTSASICSVAVGAGMKSLSIRRLYHAGVPGASSLVCADGAVYALAGTDAGSLSLLRLPRTGPAEVFCSGAGYSSLAYNKADNELFAFSDSGEADVFVLSDGGCRYSLPAPGATHVFQCGARVYITSGSQIKLLGGASDARTPVRIVLDVCPDALEPARIRRITAFFTATSVSGNLDVEGIGIGGVHRWPVFSASVRGEVRSPIQFRVEARAARMLRISFDGIVSPDFEFHTFKIE